MTTCKACNGTGWRDVRHSDAFCRECEGEGVVQDRVEELIAALRSTNECETCGGTGFYTVHTAPDAWAGFTCECDAGKVQRALRVLTVEAEGK